MILLSPPMEGTWRDIRKVFSRIGPAWELRATGAGATRNGSQSSTNRPKRRIVHDFRSSGHVYAPQRLVGSASCAAPAARSGGCRDLSPCRGVCRQGCLTAGGARRRCGARNAGGRSRCGHVMGWRAGRLPRRALRRRPRTAGNRTSAGSSSRGWRRGAGSRRSASNRGRRHSRAGCRPGWRSSASPRSTTCRTGTPRSTSGTAACCSAASTARSTSCAAPSSAATSALGECEGDAKRKNDGCNAGLQGK
jgi:hypothetical protein